MDVQKFSVLKEWNVWIYRLLVLVQCVDHVPMDSQEETLNAMVQTGVRSTGCLSLSLASRAGTPGKPERDKLLVHNCDMQAVHEVSPIVKI